MDEPAGATYTDTKGSAHLVATVVNAGVLVRNDLVIYPKVAGAGAAEGVPSLDTTDGNKIERVGGIGTISTDLSISFNVHYKAGATPVNGSAWMFHIGDSAGVSGLLRCLAFTSSKEPRFTGGDGAEGFTLIGSGSPLDLIGQITRITCLYKPNPSGTAQLYLNTTLSAEAALPAAMRATLTPNGPLRILTRDAVAGDFGNLIIDEIGIWTKLLSTAEIVELQGADPAVFRDGRFKRRSELTFSDIPHVRPTHDRAPVVSPRDGAFQDVFSFLFPGDKPSGGGGRGRARK